MRTPLFRTALALAALAAAPAVQAKTERFSGTVVAAYDPFTFRVNAPRGPRTVQLMGLALPSENGAAYEQAMEYVTEQFVGRMVWVEVDDAESGGAVTVKRTDGVNAGEELLRRGLAV